MSGSPFGMYATWVRENAEQAKKIEEMARIGAMIAPKGEHNADVLTELSYSVMGLVSLVNDTIIHGKTKRAGEVFYHPEPAVQPQVQAIRTLLTFLSHCEATMEVAVSKWSTPENRLRLIVSVEGIKALCRAYLLLLFPSQCLVAGGKYESHVVEEPVAAGAAGVVPAPTEPVVVAGSTWRGKRSGVALPVPAGMRVPANQRVVPPVDSSFLVAGETLHLLRPLLAVFAPKTRFWLLVSFAMDVASLRLLQASKASAEEVRRRSFLLVFYLFRSPLYERGLGEFTGWLRSFKETKGAGMVAEMIAFQLDFYHKTHFYSAAS